MRPRSCAKTLAGTCKEILGTAVSVGCKVDHKHPHDIMEMVGACYIHACWWGLIMLSGVKSLREHGSMCDMDTRSQRGQSRLPNTHVNVHSWLRYPCFGTFCTCSSSGGVLSSKAFASYQGCKCALFAIPAHLRHHNVFMLYWNISMLQASDMRMLCALGICMHSRDTRLPS
eukprot:1160356-Pelagomonas_calceolata.AAC.10